MKGLILDFVCLGQGYYLDVFVDFYVVVQAFHGLVFVFILAVQPFLVDAFPGVVQALLFVFFFDMSQVWFVFAVQPFLVGFGILARNLSSRCFGVSFCCLT